MTHEACQLNIEQKKRDVFQGGYVMADETPVKHQDPERNVSLLAWRTGRGAACLEDIVPPDFRGIIQCDGYSAYDAFAKTPARAATFYTLISNCHRQGIDATAYLTDIFKRLPTETNQTIHRLTPKAWIAEQAAKRHALAQSAIVQM